jgi:transposase-like protein
MTAFNGRLTAIAAVVRTYARHSLDDSLRKHKNFLAHSSTRDFTLADVGEMDEQQCFEHFAMRRFGSLTYFACPVCGVEGKHYPHRRRKQWRCADCHSTFSATSGTILHSRKLKFKKLLMAIALFTSSAKGCAATHLARQLRIQVKTAFVLLHKLREAIQLIHQVPMMTGSIEVDGGHFGGRPRSGRVRRRASANAEIAAKVQEELAAQNGVKRRPKAKRSKADLKRLKKRRIVFVIRQHSGSKGFGAIHTAVAILKGETAELVRPTISEFAAPGAVIMSDENAAYTWLSQRYDHKVVNHQVEYSTEDGVNENQAESFFSRLRRYVLGIGHRIEPKYMLDIAIEMAWREDWRRKTEQQKSTAISRGLLAPHRSKWRGYFQQRALVHSIVVE